MPGVDGDQAASTQDHGDHQGERLLHDLRDDVGSGGSAGEYRDGLRLLSSRFLVLGSQFFIFQCEMFLRAR